MALKDLIITYNNATHPGRLKIVSVTGRVNAANADQVQQAGSFAYETGARSLVLDLGGVDGITSAGLRAVLHIYRMFDRTEYNRVEVSKNLKLVIQSPRVLNVFKMAGFDEYLEIFDDAQQAILSFGSTP